MYYLKHGFNLLVNPLGIALFACALAAALLFLRRVRIGGAILAGTFVWLWVWSSGAWMRALGGGLEKPWLRAGRVPDAAELPQAEAIVVLGGGMSVATNASPYAEMHSAADRVWHAARLYRAGKAPRVIVSGRYDRASTVPLLADFGVPREAVLCEESSRNTEENARFVQELLCGGDDAARPKVLLVTSAWHMTRSVAMFRRFAPQVDFVPAPTDFEATLVRARPWDAEDVLPSVDALVFNSYFFKEYVGILASRVLKR